MRVPLFLFEWRWSHEGALRPKANAGSAGGDKERIEDFETNLNHNLYSDLEPDDARKHWSGGHEGGGRSEKDWWERILGVPTVGYDGKPGRRFAQIPDRATCCRFGNSRR